MKGCCLRRRPAGGGNTEVPKEEVQEEEEEEFLLLDLLPSVSWKDGSSRPGQRSGCLDRPPLKFFNK